MLAKVIKIYYYALKINVVLTHSACCLFVVLRIIGFHSTFYNQLNLQKNLIDREEY